MTIEATSVTATPPRRWWLLNLALYLCVAFAWSAIVALWSRAGLEDSLDSGFVVEMTGPLLFLVNAGAAPVAIYLGLLYWRKVASRLGAILSSPIVGLPVWLVPYVFDSAWAFVALALGPGLSYALIVRLREPSVHDRIRLRPTHRPAAVSLVLAIGGLVVPGVLSIPAILVGRRARSRIQQDVDLKGEELAQAAIVLGWIGIGLFVVGVLPWLAFVVMMVFQL